MDFRTAFLSACKKTKLNQRQQAAVASMENKRRFPRLWAAAEHAVARKYERETGNKVGANFDWSTIIQWMMDSLPAIIQMLMTLITIFG